MSEKRLVRYSKACHEIWSMDLLLFSGRGILSTLIKVGTQSPWSHAEVAVRLHGDLYAVGMRWTGGRMVLLSDLVDAYPGRIGVFEANQGGKWPHWDRFGAAARMLQLTGTRYGYWALWRAARRYIPFLRWTTRLEWSDDYVAEGPPICSQAIAEIVRDGGVDPVPGQKPDHLTTPADLAESLFYRYRFHLVP